MVDGYREKSDHADPVQLHSGDAASDVGICWLLCAKAGLGGWIYIPGFFFGMGGSGMVAWKLYVSVTGRQKKEETKKHISFNRHE